jgi:DNA-binding NtrC family response regulator
LKFTKVPAILAVDDDEYILQQIAEIVEDEGWLPTTLTTAHSALEHFNSRELSCAVVDLDLPDMSGLELLKHMKSSRPDIPLIVLTGQGYTVENAIEAVRNGAMSFLEKPVRRAQFVQTIKLAIESHELRISNEKLLKLSLNSRGILGESEVMKRVFFFVDHYKNQEKPILITGETGTGKSVLSETIHILSKRQNDKFYTIDCSQIPGELFASEMFGHKKGAFTGAVSDKQGMVEMADQGTLFLDEIQDLSLINQGKLKRFLECRKYTRLGDVSERSANSRLILASNRDLVEKVASKEFLQDLFMRINTFPIHLPGLNERLEDVPIIAESILRDECREQNKPFIALTTQAISYLQSMDYQDKNIRQLKTLIQRAVVLTEYSIDKQYIDERDIHLAFSIDEKACFGIPRPGMNFKEQVNNYKRELVLEALAINAFSLSRTAVTLGLSLDNLCKKVKSMDIDVEDLKKA